MRTRLAFRRSLRILIILILLVAALPAVVQAAPPPGTNLGQMHAPDKPAQPKLDALLNRLVAEHGQRPDAQVAAEAPVAQGDTVAVSIHLNGDPAAVEGFLHAHGAGVAHEASDTVEAYVPVAALAGLSAEPGATRVEAIVPPHADQGTVTSQGVAAHDAQDWQQHGISGAGVKVGIIDVGFQGYSHLVGSELPAPAAVRCYTAVGVFSSILSSCENGEVHGAAVAESLIDIAPQVTLYLATPMSKLDLQDAVSWMQSQGVQVINHSVGWLWDGPGDGTSPFADSPLRAVDQAVSGGIEWINSAGNEGQESWTGPSSDADNDGWLEFTSGNELNTFTAPAGTRIDVRARWDDSWTNASRDIDLVLFLIQTDGSLVQVASSASPQSGQPGQVPSERILGSTQSTQTYGVALHHSGGSYPSWVQIETPGQELTIPVGASSITNPAESRNPGMLAVGASPWSNTSSIEFFSSQGPTRDGRVKPDIVGADRASTVTYGTNGFAGTSQASPHVAGLAALVRQRFPTYSPGDVANYLKQNAQARGSVPNNTWGYGFAWLPPMPSTNPATPIAPFTNTADRTYFPETGHSLAYGFKSFWEHNGGLPVFGYPLTEEFTEGGYTVQYFERQRFEYHPELRGTPYEVELGLLGTSSAQRSNLLGTAPFQPVVGSSDANCNYYPETGHRVCFGFRAYWQAHGLDMGDPGYSYRESLALFGFPISEEFQQNGMTVQYFERAVLEYHPENAGTPYTVLGRLLGAEELRARGWIR